MRRETMSKLKPRNYYSPSEYLSNYKVKPSTVHKREKLERTEDAYKVIEHLGIEDNAPTRTQRIFRRGYHRPRALRWKG